MWRCPAAAHHRVDWSHCLELAITERDSFTHSEVRSLTQCKYTSRVSHLEEPAQRGAPVELEGGQQRRHGHVVDEDARRGQRRGAPLARHEVVRQVGDGVHILILICCIDIYLLLLICCFFASCSRTAFEGFCSEMFSTYNMFKMF